MERSRRMVAGGVVAAVASLGLAGISGAASADPPPRPQGHDAKAPARHDSSGKGRAGRKGHRNVWPRTSVQCQSDGSDQVDDFSDEDGVPRYTTTPGPEPAQVAGCPGAARAVHLARIVAGDRRVSRRTRHLR